MIGFACDETPELMPMTISLAHRLTRRLAAVRHSGELPWLLPDGKSQVTVEYSGGRPKRIEAVVISTHHKPGGLAAGGPGRGSRGRHREGAAIRFGGRPAQGLRQSLGPVRVGGPAADAGLTGRKIIVDTYGGVARHGGGAFSGKDPSKVDRSAAYAARHVAKNLVAAGLATRVEVQVSYAIGRAQPTSIAIETFGTGEIEEVKLLQVVRDTFDLRPAAIIDKLDLLRPIYRQTAAYGHFGRDDLDVPWERTDKVEALQAAL